MNLNKLHKVYFIGAGGIGMSAIALYMLKTGKAVAGYDRTPSPITQSLSDSGMYIQFTDDLKLIPRQFLEKEKNLIVYTPAVKKSENTILDYFLSNGFAVVKRAELLGMITKNTSCFAIAGTHGKTTTSSILGHILKESKVQATSFLGGIAENYHSNLIMGGEQYSVVEADEFDRSFLQLQPDFACVTSVDADHLDIYKTPEELEKAFKEFASLSRKKIFVKKGIPIEGITYGIDEQADFDAQNLRIENGAYLFDVKTPTDTYKDLKIHLPGQHNVLNTMAALAMANSIGVSLPNIAKALLSYSGVQRRFSYRLHSKELVLIDDYAHHPTEINAVHQAVREMYPNEKILVIFQPHLYTRTRDFESGFVQSLAKFDKILVLPIYPAREKPIPGVTSAVLIDKIQKINLNAFQINPNEIVSEITKSGIRIVILLGAGDIGEMVKDIKQELQQIAV